MPNESNKPNILFIASNIPTPKRRSNMVVMTIAHKLSKLFDISVMHPAEFAPFPFSLMKKYKNIAGRQSWNDDGIIVRPFKYIRLFGGKNAFLLLPLYRKKIKQYVKRFGLPKLIHAHFVLPDGYFAYQINKAFDVPYIISFRGSDVKLATLSPNCNTSRLLREVLSNAKHIIVHNNTQKAMVSKMGFKSILMAHGIEESFFRQKESANKSTSISIATIGELIPQKNIDWVVKAVKNYTGNKKLTLKIAGEGAIRHELESIAEEKDNIFFLGKIDHKKIGDLLNQSDIFALPSINETFGLVYLEATAHQNAVIATQGTGIWGHFIDGEEMLYCDSEQSFQEMLTLLIDNDEFRNNMAEKAYQKTREQYTWNKIISQYIELYDL